MYEVVGVHGGACDDVLDEVPERMRLALTEQVGFERYICAAHTGAVWKEGGFNLFYVAPSLTAFLSQQPGSRMRGNLQRGSRQRDRAREREGGRVLY